MRKLFLPILCILLAAACSKKEQTIVVPPSYYNSYSALDSGNYWVYGRYERDPFGNDVMTGATDSCYMAGDSTINGVVWHKYVDPTLAGGFNLLRDSLWMTVDITGAVHFATGDTATLFSTRFVADPGHLLSAADTFARIETRGAGRANVTVPAGTFATFAMSRKYTITLPPNNMPKTQILYTRWAYGMGKVSEDLSFVIGTPTILGRRLLRFRVRPIAVE